MDVSANSCKEEMEDFILREVLPYLENSWGRCSSYNGDVYKTLAQISCSRNSGKVVRHSLQLLFRLICKDDFGSSNGNLVAVELKLRNSIFSDEGMFRKDEHHEGNLKLNVYGRILSIHWLQQALQETSPGLKEEEEGLQRVQKKLRECCGKIENKKKDVFRYSTEFILKTVSCLLKPNAKLKATKFSNFLQECQEFCKRVELESKDLKVIAKLQKTKNFLTIYEGIEWIDLHHLLIHLHGKVSL